MSERFGEIVTALIMDQNEQDTFAQVEGVTYRLVGTDGQAYQLGDTVSGMIYENQKGDRLLTPEVPQAFDRQAQWAEVIETKRGLGAFVDIGLPEKDVLVSMDELPHIPALWPHPGDQLLVTAAVDRNGQFWGNLLNRDAWVDRGRSGEKGDHNRDFEARVVLLQKAGTYLLLDSEELAFVHPSERAQEPRLGEVVTGRVIGLRDDGVLYASLLPRAHEVIDDDAVMIFETLKRLPNQEMELTSKSSPQAIDHQFNISKGRFKRAIGRLLKEGLITLDEEKTALTEDALTADEIDW